MRFETRPAQQLRIDFGERRVRVGEQMERASFFVATLGCSRRRHVRACRGERREHGFEGLESAFRAFGGGPEEARLDSAPAAPRLPIVDGRGCLPSEPDAAPSSFQRAGRRHERGAMLAASDRTAGGWGTAFGDPVGAAALLDRLPHHSPVVAIRGEGHRRRKTRRSGLLQKAAPALGATTPRPRMKGSVARLARGAVPDVARWLEPSARLPRAEPPRSGPRAAASARWRWPRG